MLPQMTRGPFPTVDMHAEIDLPVETATVATNNREVIFLATTDSGGHLCIDGSQSAAPRVGPDAVGALPQ